MGLEAIVFGGLAFLAILWFVPAIFGVIFGRILCGAAKMVGINENFATKLGILAMGAGFMAMVWIIGTDPFELHKLF